MRLQLGVVACVVMAFLLAGCDTATQQPSARVPAAALAPITTVTGVLPHEGGGHGVITGGGVTYAEGSGFMEPYSTFNVEADGSFSVALPTDVDGFGYETAYGTCDFVGHAFTGMIMVFNEPIAVPMPDKARTGVFTAFSGEAQVLYWYSPSDMRVTCRHETGRGLTGVLEDWDLRLVAGWNQALVYQTEERAYFRSGVPAGVAWEPVEER